MGASRRGMLVAFEGIDGAGKTTQVQLLAHHQRATGVEVVSTKEPTSGPHGTRLRASATTGRLSPGDELALFEADRREHVAEIIHPALERGAVVLVDRYYFSTAAYQGARGFDPEDILARNETFAPAPDLLVLLDLPVEEALARIRRRGDGSGNAFERQEALTACAAIFARFARPSLLRVDATQTPEAIHAQILERLPQANPSRRHD